MDYLVDGIIELVRSEQFDRVFREVEVQKLRGTVIDQHKYLYTLLGGKFAHFKAYRPPGQAYQRRIEPVADYQRSDGTYYSFGSPDLDAAVSGIKKGSVFTIEYAESVPYSAIRTIELGVIVNLLNLGRSAVLLPLPGGNESDLEALVAPLVSREAWKNNFATIPGLGRATETRDMLQRKTDVSAPRRRDDSARSQVKSAHVVAQRILEDVKKNSMDGSTLFVTSLSMTENALASDLGLLLEALAGRVSWTQRKGSPDSMLVLIQSDSVIRSRVLSMSNQHARLFVKDRTVVLLGEKPSTEAYVLEHSPANAVLPVLTKVV
jgi:hypothetical protein